MSALSNQDVNQNITSNFHLVVCLKIERTWLLVLDSCYITQHVLHSHDCLNSEIFSSNYHRKYSQLTKIQKCFNHIFLFPKMFHFTSHHKQQFDFNWTNNNEEWRIDGHQQYCDVIGGILSRWPRSPAGADQSHRPLDDPSRCSIKDDIAVLQLIHIRPQQENREFIITILLCFRIKMAKRDIVRDKRELHFIKRCLLQGRKPRERKVN